MQCCQTKMEGDPIPAGGSTTNSFGWERFHPGLDGASINIDKSDWSEWNSCLGGD